MLITRRAALKGVVATAVGTVAGVGAYGVGYERHHLETTDTELAVSGLAPALDGLRIGFLTDLHHSAMVPAEDISHAVDRIMQARTDLLVLGGDYVTWGDRNYVGPVSELLAPLAAPFGVFAILGNHDDDRAMPAALASKHIQVLKDARTRVEIRGEGLELAGIRFWTRKAADIARVIGRPRDTVLLLAHDPRRLAEAAALDVPAVLSGHTHGGQVVLPGVGALARRQFPVLSGLGSRGNTNMFVSRGVGTVYVPIRINCPPEASIVTLRRKSDI